MANEVSIYEPRTMGRVIEKLPGEDVFQKHVLPA